MPGIVGLITKKPREEAEKELCQMLKSLRHEPFYKTGTWSDERLGVYVGWVARQGCFAEEMPLFNEEENVVLVFSGDEFPEPGTASNLREQGHTFPTEGPGYLVHLYEEDARFPASLNGKFQGLLVDQNTGLATLFNDRYGMNRVYYHESADGFYFAPEAKAILSVRPELRRIDSQSLGEFISHGCVLEDRSLFEGVPVLPAASAWTFSNGSLTARNSYFQTAEWESQTRLDAESYYREIREVFSRTLPRYFGNTEPAAVALTGGLDTRAIMAWWDAAPGSLPCYTFGGTRRDCQDVKIARRVAELCRQRHEVIEVGEEFLSRFPFYAEQTVYRSEGNVDVSNAPDLYVSQKARQIAPAKVVGTWGSEILRQVVTFKPSVPLNGLFDDGVGPYLETAENTYRRIRGEHPVTFSAFVQAKWHHHGIFGLEETNLSVRCPFLDNEFVRTVYRAPLDGPGDIRLRLIADGNPVLAGVRSDRGVGGTAGIGEKAARLWQELTFKAEYAYDYGMPQWAAGVDHHLAPLRLDRLFLGRHKFAHFRVWYRDRFAQYVREILLDPQALARPYLQRRAVESIVEGHLTGRANHTSTIHQLLTLELLHRHFL